MKTNKTCFIIAEPNGEGKTAFARVARSHIPRGKAYPAGMYSHASARKRGGKGEKNENQCHHPEMKGCYTQGESLDEVTINIKGAIVTYFPLSFTNGSSFNGSLLMQDYGSLLSGEASLAYSHAPAGRDPIRPQEIRLWRK